VFIFGDKGIDKLVGAIGINHYFFSSATTCNDRYFLQSIYSALEGDEQYNKTIVDQ
jgi:hypothetical protein